MMCHVCGSKMTKRVTDLPFKLTEGAIVIIKQLPVIQCTNCAEYLMEDRVMTSVEKILAKVDGSAELEIVKYAA